MTAQQVVTGALFIDMGRATQDGRYTDPPRARYECLLCQRTDGPVTGPTAVTAFVATASTHHRATCPANRRDTP